MRHVSPAARTLAGLSLLVSAWAGACSNDGVGLTSEAEQSSAAVISDTVIGTTVTAAQTPPWSQSSPAGVAASTPESQISVAYISLAPGTEPRGVTATIRNQQTGSITTVPLVSGGFDPVVVPAKEGDLLEIEILANDGAALLHVVRRVPGKRPPKVVRTNPPTGKRDVALNATILVVFSEPIDPSTLDETSLTLLRDGLPVAGRVVLQDPAQLAAVFIPAAPLASATNYRLVVADSIRDLDGEPVGIELTVDFTTGTGSEPALAGRIAFSNWVSISVINADGTGLTTLVDGGRGWQYMSPAWSPDGTQIAFGSDRDGGWGIYVMRADGSWVTRLSRGSARDDAPAWSPDGRRIAFTSDRDGDFEIHVMNADGSDVIRLTDHPAADGNPAWSPDGTLIAFTSDRDSVRNQIFVMDVNGTGVTRLTNVSDEAIHPEWSPDGRQILFTRTVAGNHIMNADGSRMRPLGANGGGATWSPDGERIVFSNWNLFVIRADGSGLRNLNAHGYEPAWSVERAP